jgi:hypothetical protein
VKFGENSLDKMTTIDLFALAPWVFQQLGCILCYNVQGAKERGNITALTNVKFGENSMGKMLNLLWYPRHSRI